MPTLLLLAVVFSIITHSGCSTSNLYQPGRGVFLERWIFTSRSFDLQKFSNIPNFPTCPTRAENLDKFEKNELIVSSYQHARFSAYFVSLQTGSHKFFVICDNNCKIEIEELPFGFKTILEDSGRTLLNWNSRKYSAPLILMAGFRYLLRLYMYGNGQSSDFAALGVEFPDGTENKPIDSRYLWRSKTMYSWQGLLGRRYNGITFTYSDVRMKRFYQDNADKFPSRPSYFTCLPSLVEEKTDSGDNYAMKFTGYLRLPESAQYNFRFHANEIAELRISKSNSTTLHQTAKLTDSPTLFDGGFFNHSIWYHVDAVRVEGVVTDWLTLEFSKGTNAFSSSWDGNLKNIFVEYQLPPPTPTMLNSSAISATLTVEPFLPAEDGWSPTGQFEILAFETSAGASAVVQKQAFTGPLPHVHTFTGLKNYTVYSFYAHYYGAINGTVTYNIITNSSQLRTDENVPEVPPPNIFVRSLSSKSVRAAWNALLDPALLNGICTGFEVKYRIQNPIPKNWTSFQIDSPSTREFNPINLEEYTTYEIIVAAKTSKGSGVFSQPSTVTTNEDSPSAPPMNIIAGNISSTSIRITWDDVSYWDKNGVITGYKVYMSKIESMKNARVYSLTDRSITINDLDVWGIYYIQVSALTSIGEGPKSNATLVRTDEDTPSAPPTNVSTRAESSYSINVTWSDILQSKTNGIILDYKVLYQRTDGRGTIQAAFASEKTALLVGLESFVDYSIKVAGSTVKGFGVESLPIIQKTLISRPSAPPVNINGRNISSTAIQVSWGLVPPDDRNGPITGYDIRYKAQMENDNAWRHITVSSPTLLTNISGLDYYTWYEVKVAGINSAGHGVYSNATVVRTDAYAPGKPPMNLTGIFLNHTSILLRWRRVPEAYRYGVIVGYRLYIIDKTRPSAQWTATVILNSFNGSDSFSYVFTGLKTYTPYIFKITAYTVKAEGPPSQNLTIWTDEYVPREYPKHVTDTGANSTQIRLHWTAMDEVHGDANGKVLGYTAKYHVVDCHEDRPLGCDEQEMFNLTVHGNSPSIVLPNLRKYTQYNVAIQMFNSKGRGNFSNELTVKTDQDTPDASPKHVEAWPATYTSIKLFWSPIPESLRNGIILGYRMFYKPIDAPLRKYSRSPRAVNSLAVYGAEPGEKMMEVNATTFEVEIEALQDYDWYQIRIGAYTSKGLGVVFSLNGTCKQRAPSVAPIIVSLKDMYDFHQVSLEWKDINKTSANGEVLGYRIMYWLSEQNFASTFDRSVTEIRVLAPNTSLVISNLHPFSTYGINMSAFTEGGYGPQSSNVFAETCRCPKSISSTFLHLPPLLHKSQKNESVLREFLTDGVTFCCANCSGKHGLTHIDWNSDAMNASSLKYSRTSLMSSLNNGTHMALPIYDQGMDVHDQTTYVYVPIVPVMKFLVFKRRLTLKVLGNSATKIVVNSLWKQYPLLLVSLVLTLLAGIALWATESTVNTDEFPRSYLRGMGSGVWLAFITMTTVGYGDLNVMSRAGRFIAVTWMLIGLILMSMMIGNLSTNFATQFVFRPQPLVSSEKVLCSEEAFKICSQLYPGNFKFGNMTNGEFVQNQLISGNSSRVLLDPFQAMLLSKFLDHPQIILESVLDQKASYGVALAAEAKRISTCLRKYVSENEPQLLTRIAEATSSFKTGLPIKDNLADHMTSSHSDLMENFHLFGSIALILFIIVGIIYEIVRCTRGRAKVQATPNQIDAIFNEISEGAENLEAALLNKITEMESLHIKERITLYKLQAGKFEQLLKWYPDLPLYDPTMPKMTKDNGNKILADIQAGFEQEDDGDTSSSEEIDMPIDYRMSHINLRL